VLRVFSSADYELDGVLTRCREERSLYDSPEDLRAALAAGTETAEALLAADHIRLPGMTVTGFRLQMHALTLAGRERKKKQKEGRC
jgi:hypothetical protein